MTVRVSQVIIGGTGNLENYPRYLLEEAQQVINQPGSTGLQQINVQFEGHDMTGIVAANSDGVMLGSEHLVALPCPPNCPGKGKWDLRAFAELDEL
jgi:hypothetical protein